jgi:hypothetical protein
MLDDLARIAEAITNPHLASELYAWLDVSPAFDPSPVTGPSPAD